MSTATTMSAASCAEPWDHCADPSWSSPTCCTASYVCTYSDEHWARCQPASSTSNTTRVQTTPSTTTTTLATTTKTMEMDSTCVAPWEHCFEPGWPIPKCCTSGHTCTFANVDWARCQPQGLRKLSFLAKHHALIQKNMSSGRYIVASGTSGLEQNSEL